MPRLKDAAPDRQQALLAAIKALPVKSDSPRTGSYNKDLVDKIVADIGAGA